MYSSEFVEKQIAEMKAAGTPLQSVAWRAAVLCTGWAYVFGARGQYCTPANRRARYSDAHPTIKTKCKNFDGSGSCTGCKWYPKNERTRFFDCRGFTYWILLQVYGWKLMGAGATSQWDTASNWKAKGVIADMPKDTLVCLFVKNGAKMEHTGFGFNNETVECSNGVQYFTTRNAKWTHYGIPACIDSVVPPAPSPTPEPTPDKKPTLRRGSKGEYVTLAQTELIQKGYSCGSFGADGQFGAATEMAVREFQKSHTDENGNPLTVDGVIGQKTWWALLENTEPAPQYTITIPHLSKSQADALILQYPGSTMTEERG